MWTQVPSDDVAGLERHVALMHQMDRGYGKLAARDVGLALSEQRGELWCYEGQGFEIGMLFQYSWERGHWQLAQVGFTGAVAPADVLEHNIERTRAFFTAQGITSLFCAPPHTVDYAPLLEYYGRCLEHPELRITIVHRSEKRDIWEVAFAGP